MISLSQVGKEPTDATGQKTFKKVFIVTTGLRPQIFSVKKIVPNTDKKTAEVHVDLPGGREEIQKNVPLNNKVFHVNDPKSPVVDLKTAYEEMYGKKDLGLMESDMGGNRCMLQRKSDGKYLTHDRRYTGELESAGVFNVGDVDPAQVEHSFPNFRIIPVNEGHGDVHYWGAQPKSKEYAVSSKPDKATMALREMIQTLVSEIICEDHEQEHGYSEHTEIKLIQDIDRIAQISLKRGNPMRQDIESIKKISGQLLSMHKELQEDKNPMCKSCGKPVNANVSPSDKCNCVS